MIVILSNEKCIFSRVDRRVETVLKLEVERESGTRSSCAGYAGMGRLGTGTDFSEVFPMDFRHLGTGEAI